MIITKNHCYSISKSMKLNTFKPLSILVIYWFAFHNPKCNSGFGMVFGHVILWTLIFTLQCLQNPDHLMFTIIWFLNNQYALAVTKVKRKKYKEENLTQVFLHNHHNTSWNFSQNWSHWHHRHRTVHWPVTNQSHKLFAI